MTAFRPTPGATTEPRSGRSCDAQATAQAADFTVWHDRPFGIGRGTLLLGLFACFVLLLAGCGEGKQADVVTGPEVPWIEVADAEKITALRQEAAEAGKVLVIDCWATWCGSCVAMFPGLHKAIKERGDGVMLVSLTFDEGDKALFEAEKFLAKHDATQNAYAAAAGSDATDDIAKALSDNWGGTILPAVFVYGPDGATAYELLETRGDVQDWVDAIVGAVDGALPEAEGSPGQ